MLNYLFCKSHSRDSTNRLLWCLIRADATEYPLAHFPQHWLERLIYLPSGVPFRPVTVFFSWGKAFDSNTSDSTAVTRIFISQYRMWVSLKENMTTSKVNFELISMVPFWESWTPTLECITLMTTKTVLFQFKNKLYEKETLCTTHWLYTCWARKL